MTDDLRTRISDAIWGEARTIGSTLSGKAADLIADAVIRELKLTEESGNDFAYGWKCPVCARGMEADHGPVCNQAPPVNLHRYVTEWTADD